MKIAFCGFDFFYEALSECLKGGHELLAGYSFNVDGVYNSNARVAMTCAQRGVDLKLERISEADVETLKHRGCELLIAAAYPYRIPTKALARAGIVGVNVHPSLLPDGRGPWPLPHVILRGLERSGVTLHQITHEFDAGPIILQGEFSIQASENLESLSAKCRIAASELLCQFMNDVEDHLKAARVQGGDGSYWPKPTDAERTVNWNDPVRKIDRIVRAFGHFDSYANFDGKDWLIQDATVWTQEHKFEVGTVVCRTDTEVVIAALDGFVCIRQFKPDPTTQ